MHYKQQARLKCTFGFYFKFEYFHGNRDQCMKNQWRLPSLGWANQATHTHNRLSASRKGEKIWQSRKKNQPTDRGRPFNLMSTPPPSRRKLCDTGFINMSSKKKKRERQEPISVFTDKCFEPPREGLGRPIPSVAVQKQ